jgi:FlaA1/EpsC-like NDP-sugar epimerase
MNQYNLNSKILILDLSWSIPALIAALLLRYGADLGQVSHSALALLPFLAATWMFWPLLSLVRPLHGFGSGPDGKFNAGGLELAAVSHLLLSMGGLTLILLGGGYLFHSDAPRLTLVYFGMLLLAGFILIRAGVYGRRPEARSPSEAVHRIVIVGRGPLVEELAGRRRSPSGVLARLWSIFFPDDEFAEVEVLSGSETAIDIASVSIVDLLSKQKVDELILTLPGRVPSHLLSLAAACRERGIRVNFVPQLYELYLSQAPTTDLPLKSVLDFVLKVMLSLVALPLAVPAMWVLTFRAELAISGYVSSARTAVSGQIPQPLSIFDR